MGSEVTIRTHFSESEKRTQRGMGTDFSSCQKWVAWISLDPRTGRITLYPPTIAAKLEHAYSCGSTSLDLGEEFFGASVGFKPQMKQHTKNGSRDVRRVEMDEPSGCISVSIVLDGFWRAATRADSTGTEERTLSVQLGDMIEAAR